MARLRKLSMAILILAVGTSILAVSAQEAPEVDEDICVLKDTQCTCAQSPATGDCTRPAESGNCVQGDCTPSYKCDCFGFELCAINSCGTWSPAVNAILSRTAEFQCKYEPEGAKCRTAENVMDTVSSADNANVAVVKYVDDVVVDEVDMAQELQETLTWKIRTIDAVRAIQEKEDDIPEEEKEVEEVQNLAEEIVAETEEIAKDLAEAAVEATISFKAMVRARRCKARVEKLEKEYKAVEQEEEIAAKKEKRKKWSGPTGKARKERCDVIRTSRKKESFDAGTWAKKGREGRVKADKKKKSVKKRQAKVKTNTAMCVARSQKILDRRGKK